MSITPIELGNLTGTVTPNLVLTSHWYIYLDGNLTIGFPTADTGQELVLQLVESGGTHTLTFNGAYVFSGSAPAFSGSNQTIRIGFQKVGTSMVETFRTGP